MLYDGIELTDTSVVANLTIVSGNDLPTTNLNVGELFYKLNDGLYVFDGAHWVKSSTGGQSAGEGISLIQVGDGNGGFLGIPAPAEADLVLTSNTVGLPTWEPAQTSGGTVTSVNVLGGTTGIAFTGGPITHQGSVTMEGCLAIKNGGTGATSVSGALSNLLPDQTGNQGAALLTDGSSLRWEVLPGSAYTAGPGLELQGSEFRSVVAVANGVAGRVPVTVGDGTLTNLAPGINGYVLTSNGDGVPPSWKNVSGTVSEIQIYNSASTGLIITGGDPMDPPQTSRTRITTTGEISLAGVLSVQHGGTGASSISNALTNLLPAQSENSGKFLTTNGSSASWGDPYPDQTGNSGKFLKTNGTSVIWETPAGGGTVTSVDIDGGTSGFMFTGGPITQNGVFTLSGMLSIQHGGTGANTANSALNNLLPAQTGNSGKILTTNGTNSYWSSTGAGSVTSVDISNDSGLTFSGGPITSSGTFTVGGVLSVQHGGTGASSASTAISNLLPDQNGNSGKVLSTNGSSVYWTDSGSGVGTVTSVDINGSSTGLVFSGGPITSSGTISMSGILSISNGGTGSNTANGALNSLLPTQTGNSGKILTTNGTSASWTTAGAGSVTSVEISGGVTGLVFSGGPITSSGTITASGTLAIANGGTGASSAQSARNNLLPPQASNAGFVLSTNGTDASWVNPSTISIPAGNNAQVQYNKNGAFAGAANLTFNDSTGTLTATAFAGNGAALTNLNGSEVKTGTIPVARLGGGTPSSSTYLRGDGNWTTHYDAKYDMALSIAGKPAASVYVLNFAVVNSFLLPASLTGSVAKSSTAATSSSSFTIYKNAASIGTITFAAGSSTGTFTFSSQQTFAAGDLIQISAPGTQDSTLANIAITLKGTLTA